MSSPGDDQLLTRLAHGEASSVNDGTAHEHFLNADGMALGSATSNIFGGKDFYDAHGANLGHTLPGLNGSSAIVSQNGHILGHETPNIFGGHDFSGVSGQAAGHTSANIFGGQDVYSSSGQLVGHSTPNIFGGHDFHANTAPVHVSVPTHTDGETT